MTGALAGFRMAWASLTRLPGGRHPDDAGQLAAAVPWFGVVGLLVGAAAAAGFASAVELGFSGSVAAMVAITVGVLIGGGFHEDGLADSFDALVGGWDTEQRLRILKDSRHGTYGVLSLVLVVAWKLVVLAGFTSTEAFLALVASHTIGRSAAVGVMGTVVGARPTGLGASYQRGLAPGPTVAGVAVGVIAAIAAAGWWAPLVLLVAGVGAGLVAWWGKTRIGGVTGDLLGAVEQISEVLVLLTMAWVLRHVSG